MAVKRGLGRWVYLASFGAGLAVAFVAWAVCRALGAVDASSTVDLILGLIAAAFSFSFLTGINLGKQPSLRHVVGDAGEFTDTRAGLCLAAFAAALVFVGPFVTALL